MSMGEFLYHGTSRSMHDNAIKKHGCYKFDLERIELSHDYSSAFGWAYNRGGQVDSVLLELKAKEREAREAAAGANNHIGTSLIMPKDSDIKYSGPGYVGDMRLLVIDPAKVIGLVKSPGLRCYSLPQDSYKAVDIKCDNFALSADTGWKIERAKAALRAASKKPVKTMLREIADIYAGSLDSGEFSRCIA